MPRSGLIVQVSTALFIVLFAAASGFSVENAADADFVFARKAFEDGFYDLARERLESLLKDCPITSRLYEAHSLLGRCRYYQNNLARALYDFDFVLNAPAGSEFQDEALYWSGEIHLKNADHKRALEFYQKVIEDFPSSKYFPYALYSKGWVYYKLGSFEDALACFREVALKYPFDKAAMEALFRAAECEYLLARYEKAEEMLADFVRAFPVSAKTSDAYYLKGETEFHRGRYRDSVADFERALSISPAARWAAPAMYRTAESLSRLGDHAGSMVWYKRCMAAADDDFLKGLALLGLGRSCRRQGLEGSAQAAYDDILKSYPDAAAASEAYYRKTKFLREAGRHEDAEGVCREGIAKLPKGEYAHELRYELGLLCLAQDRGEEAAKEFVKVKEGSGDMNLRSAAMTRLGDIYFDRREYVKAMDYYDAVLDRYPESAPADHAQYQIGNIFLAAGRFDQAILAYRSIIANFPKTALRQNIAFHLGVAHFEKGEFDPAAAEFQSFMDRRPEPASLAKARFYLANSLYAMNRYEEALRLFKRTIKESKYPDIRMMARYQLGWCYYNLGREAEAIGEFEAFVRDHPGAVLSADAAFFLGERHRSKARYDKAKECFLSIIRGYPSSGISKDAHYRLMLTLLDEGRLGEALSKLEEFAGKFPDETLLRAAYKKAAGAARERRDFEKALECYGKALGREDTELNAQVQYEIAECLEEKGDLPEAAEEYLKVPRLYRKGTFWAIRAELKCAMLFERLGRIDEAKGLYEKLAGMDVEESEFARGRLAELR